MHRSREPLRRWAEQASILVLGILACQRSAFAQIRLDARDGGNAPGEFVQRSVSKDREQGRCGRASSATTREQRRPGYCEGTILDVLTSGDEKRAAPVSVRRSGRTLISGRGQNAHGPIGSHP
jgi:hypothetical protein